MKRTLENETTFMLHIVCSFKYTNLVDTFIISWDTKFYEYPRMFNHLLSSYFKYFIFYVFFPLLQKNESIVAYF
jgi:hypothetical protein